MKYKDIIRLSGKRIMDIVENTDGTLTIGLGHDNSDKPVEIIEVPSIKIITKVQK